MMESWFNSHSYFECGDILTYQVRVKRWVSWITGGTVYKKRFCVVKKYDPTTGLITKRYIDPLDWIKIWFRLNWREFVWGFVWMFVRDSDERY